MRQANKGLATGHMTKSAVKLQNKMAVGLMRKSATRTANKGLSLGHQSKSGATRMGNKGLSVGHQGKTGAMRMSNKGLAVKTVRAEVVWHGTGTNSPTPVMLRSDAGK